VAGSLGVCVDCLRERPRRALALVAERRRKWRARLGLPPIPPREKERGVPCGICVNSCFIGEGGRGYCGVWAAERGRLASIVGYGRLIAYTYLDPHPTNCVAEPVCPGATGRGYPRFTFTRGVERGYYNLAVFLGGCPLDCVYCQNWQHKVVVSGAPPPSHVKSVGELVEEALNPRVTCICYFGGDPTPQLPLVLRANRIIVREAERRGQWPKRICWETNGLASPGLLRAAALQSLESGGIVKVDWKAWSPSVYEALTGVNGERALERLRENTRMLASIASERGEPPLLVVSVLLVPGYVDVKEVRGIARYLAGLMEEYSVNIPLVLLGFHPDYLARDLPVTSRRHALEAREAAVEEGVREVYIGNAWLLGDDY